jgi:hypothetical protein
MEGTNPQKNLNLLEHIGQTGSGSRIRRAICAGSAEASTLQSQQIAKHTLFKSPAPAAAVNIITTQSN